MARDFLEIGPVPSNEDCQQVGTAHYDPIKARLECQCFVEQLRRQFGPEPEGARLRVKSNPHDFSNYLEVVCNFDDAYSESVEYAFKCEGEAWADWDTASRIKLGLTDRNCEDFESLGNKLSE